MKLFESYQDNLSLQKKLVLGLQHTFTMFGATILVPLLTGFNVSVALFMAGCSTLLFHLITRGKIPLFLGSSFAFIAPVILVSQTYGLAYAAGGIVVSGLVYLVMAALIAGFGLPKVLSFFPPLVTSPIIMVIGLTLAPVAITNASTNWALAFLSFATVVGFSVFAKGFPKVLSVLMGLLVGYFVAVVTGNIDFQSVLQADWVGLPAFTLAKFNLNAIILMAPVALVTVVEHIGAILAVGNTCKKEFAQNPGLHRTLLGDGLASILSGMGGGPANTTYSENTGVLALTGVYNPLIMRIAALFAIGFAVTPKISALIGTIPQAVIGGVSIVLFGMIAMVGLKNLVETAIDLTKPKNLIIIGSTLVLGMGNVAIPLEIGQFTFTLSGMVVAAFMAIVLNKVLKD